MSGINVKWNDPNTYKTQPAKKQQIETDVKQSSATTSAVNRGATDAIIMCVEDPLTLLGTDVHPHIQGRLPQEYYAGWRQEGARHCPIQERQR